MRDRERCVPQALIVLAILGGLAVVESRRPGRELNPALEAARNRRAVPLQFEAVEAGVGHPEKFIARRGGGSVVLDHRQLELAPARAGNPRQPVRLRWMGANPHARPAGLEPTGGRTDYFLGQDPSRWRTGVRTFSRVCYPELYPGVDLVCYPQGQNLEYDFSLAPGASPSSIRLTLEGVRQARIDPNGDLVAETEAGEVRQRRPCLYQEVEGRRRAVPGRFTLASAGPDPVFGFEVGPYDRSRRLIIDPVLEFSSYLGGSDEDEATAVAVSPDGSRIYIAGETASVDFPTANPVQSPAPGGRDLFVTVLAARTGRVLYSACIGGSGYDAATGVATDRLGRIYLTGTTDSPDFPPVSNVQRSLAGGTDAVMLKLNPVRSGPGALVFSTYLGGEGNDKGGAVTVLDSAGDRACVCGSTASDTFPTTPGAFQKVRAGGADAFVTLFEGLAPEKPQRARLAYSTFLGGPETDFGLALAPVSTDRVYLAGAAGPGFPTVAAGAYQSVHRGGSSDAFAAQLTLPGSGSGTLPFSTLLGGNGNEEARAVAIDSQGRLYLTGPTRSDNFPTVRALPEIPPSAEQDAFVAQIERPASGAARLLFCARLGGAEDDQGNSIAVRAGRPAAAVTVFVAGQTASPDLPVINGVQGYGGAADAFVTALNVPSEGNPTLDYYTYLGGEGADTGAHMAVDPAGVAILAGKTDSEAFRHADPVQPYLNGATDAFIARVLPTGAGRLAVTPHRVNFGSVRAKAEEPESANTRPARVRTLRLINRGRGALAVSVGIPVGPFKLRPADARAPLYLAPREKREIKVTFDPPAAGDYEATLTLTGNAPRSRPVRVQLLGRGH